MTEITDRGRRPDDRRTSRNGKHLAGADDAAKENDLLLAVVRRRGENFAEMADSLISFLSSAAETMRRQR